MSSGRVAWVKGHIQWHLVARPGVAATQHLYLRILSWQRLLVVIQVPEKGGNRGFPSNFIEVGVAWRGRDWFGLNKLVEGSLFWRNWSEATSHSQVSVGI